MLHHEVRAGPSVARPGVEHLGDVGWSISASAWRSASKRASTSFVSMPGLMSLSATGAGPAAPARPGRRRPCRPRRATEHAVGADPLRGRPCRSPADAGMSYARRRAPAGPRLGYGQGQKAARTQAPLRPCGQAAPHLGQRSSVSWDFDAETPSPRGKLTGVREEEAPLLVTSYPPRIQEMPQLGVDVGGVGDRRGHLFPQERPKRCVADARTPAPRARPRPRPRRSRVAWARLVARQVGPELLEAIALQVTGLLGRAARAPGRGRPGPGLFEEASGGHGVHGLPGVAPLSALGFEGQVRTPPPRFSARS